MNKPENCCIGIDTGGRAVGRGEGITMSLAATTVYFVSSRERP